MVVGGTGRISLTSSAIVAGTSPRRTSSSRARLAWPEFICSANIIRSGIVVVRNVRHSEYEWGVGECVCVEGGKLRGGKLGEERGRDV